MKIGFVVIPKEVFEKVDFWWGVGIFASTNRRRSMIRLDLVGLDDLDDLDDPSGAWWLGGWVIWMICGPR